MSDDSADTKPSTPPAAPNPDKNVADSTAATKPSLKSLAPDSVAIANSKAKTTSINLSDEPLPRKPRERGE